MRHFFSTDWWEFAGVVTGVIGVYLVTVEHIWNWSVGIINVLLYAYVFWGARLFADMSLQFFFLALQIHGWYQWAYGAENVDELPITRLSLRTWLWLTPACLGLYAIYVPIVSHFKGAQPWVDSALTVLSIAAQFMTNFKKIECWAFWILIDLIFIPLYISRGLHSTAVLYGLFLVLAVAGWMNWYRLFCLGLKVRQLPMPDAEIESPYPR